MISERLAGRRPSQQSLAPRWSRRAVAGRKRLTEALGESVLVQLALAMSFIALAALLYMAQAGQISVQQINIAVLRNERVQLVGQNATLQSQATALQSTQRVDDIAVNQLHMGLGETVVWVTPTVPHVRTVRPVNADMAAADRASQPLTQMIAFLRAVHDSL